MTLRTTTIGAYPKPAYLPTPDWFRKDIEFKTATAGNPTAAFNDYLATLSPEVRDLLDRATREVVQAQVAYGIDIPTDGEVRRENYIYHVCRNLNGFDFDSLTHQILRNGQWEAWVPTVRGPISSAPPMMANDFRIAQAATDKPVKITLPGPLTICGSTADDYYHDPKALGADLAAALNKEVLALVDAGCKWIQIDEPVFARTPDQALDFGFENLERCFAGVPADVNRVVHMCCGYPMGLDETEYEKADPGAYFELAAAIDASSIDAISLEDAHRHNDLALLAHFKKTTVIWGAVAIARSRIETPAEIRERLTQVLDHIDAERLIVAPDCGLGYLTDEMVAAKLRNMSEAAHAF